MAVVVVVFNAISFPSLNDKTIMMMMMMMKWRRRRRMNESLYILLQMTKVGHSSHL
jgi:hypothetical protein